MVTPKAKGAAAKSGPGRRPAAGGTKKAAVPKKSAAKAGSAKARAAAPKGRPAPKGKTAAAPKPSPARARVRPAASPTSAAKSARTRPPATARGPAVRSTGSTESMERLRAIQQEKGELQELLRQARAELDSALAESAQLRERLRARDADDSRGAARQEEPAGPGEFDPAADLDDDIPSMNEDDLEGAAGFFDRMDEIRARRNELDRERNDRELEQSEQSFWMICPKCGDLMEEQESENVKLERCENCGGLYLDRGEVDLLLTLSTGAEGARRLHNVLKF